MFTHMVNTLPHFLAYFLCAILFFTTFLGAYVMITPHKELTLIRQGNTAAATQLVGALLGFVIPLSVVIGHSVNIPDMLAWGIVTLVVQAITFWLIQVIFKNISDKISDGCMSSAVFVGGLSLAVGVLQAGCMVP